MNERTSFYYADEEAQRALMQQKVKLPPGYEFVALAPEDAHEVVATSLHYDEGDKRIIAWAAGQRRG